MGTMLKENGWERKCTDGPDEPKKMDSLVPDLELCRKIPEWAFEDSALVWDSDYERWYVVERGMADPDIAIPAPTLEEILIAQPRIVLIFQYNYDYDTSIWRAGIFDSRQGLISKYDCKPVNAALKLWLELKKDGGKRK